MYQGRKHVFVKKNLYKKSTLCLSIVHGANSAFRWTVSHPIILSVYYADLHSMCAFLIGSWSGGQEARSVVRRE